MELNVLRNTRAVTSPMSPLPLRDRSGTFLSMESKGSREYAHKLEVLTLKAQVANSA
jgi:hypothetical protein